MTNFLLATSVRPITYSITPNISSVNEGSAVSFTVATTGIINGTTLYWTNSGTTSAADFSGSTNSGSFTVTDGLSAVTATITRTLLADSLTEGSETVILNLRTGSTSGPIVATSTTVTVNDTSLTPAYAVDFNGTNQYLAAGSSAASVSNFGTGDFTVEAWIYPRQAVSKSFITNSDNAGATTNTYFNVSYFSDAAWPGYVYFGMQIRDTSSQAYMTGNERHAINNWYHVAVTRTSGACRLFVNGYLVYVQGGATSANTAYTGSTVSITITKSVTARATILGAFLYSGATAYANCRLSGVRIIRGTALYYTGGPPTPPVSFITNTTVIACQSSSSTTDSSGNGVTISATNAPTVTSYP